MAEVALWRTPWAMLSREKCDYLLLRPGVSQGGSGAFWLCTDMPGGPLIAGRKGSGKELFDFSDGRRVFAMPIPLRPSAGIAVDVGGQDATVRFAHIPDRPAKEEEARVGEPNDGVILLNRVKAVWARLRELEAAIADPATIWGTLGRLWLASDPGADPEMDIIVTHARELTVTLDLLDRAPRRVLRRTHRMIPLARVQEIDRRSMTWLVRQPGETMAERAGSRQRIDAVAREESFDTPENRVLVSYARLAGAVARDYVAIHPRAAGTGRVRRVAGFARRCRQLEADFVERGVGEAEPDATPNFVLQNNPSYRAVWNAWMALLRRRRIIDELWRWQARSWEEFCALAVVVALQSIADARPIATSPLVFREEQEQGCWLKHVNPLAVFYLPRRDVIVEVSYGPPSGEALRRFGAPLWLRLGQVGNNEFLTRWAVWPIWHAEGGLVDADVGAIAERLSAGHRELVRGGIALRPVAAGGAAELTRNDQAACLTIAPSGEELRRGIELLRGLLETTVLRGLG